jgi:type I restriction enzyme S subunit
MKLPRYPKYKDSGVKWLGQVPEHWEVIRLKYVASMKGRLGWQGLRSDEYTEEGPFLVTSEHFTNDRVDWNRCFHVSEDRYAIAPEIQLRPDDVLMMKDGAAMGKLAYVEHLPGPACLNSHLLLFRPLGGRFENRFLYYVLGGPDFNGYMIRERTGTTFFGISQERIASFPFAIPPLSEQERILRFIDVEASRMDALISEQQCLIDLLKENRQSIISRAVTKGLNPNAPMKPSGIDWIGDIPVHWDVERTRWLFAERDQRSKTGEEEMLTVSHLTGVTPRSEKNVTMFEAETNEGYKLCRAGDLVINTLWAWMGAMGIAPIFGMVSPAYNVYVPGKRLWPSYVDSLVRMPLFAQEITRYSKGVWTSRLRLYPEGLYQAYFPVPPLDEQKTIAEHIANESARIDSLILAANTSIEILQERRAILISNAATGRIDVRNYRPEGAAAVCQ